MLIGAARAVKPARRRGLAGAGAAAVAFDSRGTACDSGPPPMASYLVRRMLYMLILLWVITVVAFVIIQLPEGDFVSSYASQLARQGEEVNADDLANLRRRFGLDRPMHVQYLLWFGNLLRGDFGYSFQFNRPVGALIGERLGLTIALSLSTLIFTYALAIPIGIYSATHQYSAGDYAFMSVGFVGLATPNFLLALILMYFLLRRGFSVGGLFSAEYQNAPWSLSKVWDLMLHLPLPIIIVGTAGTAALIRIMRGILLDELKQQYVVTARAKGVDERALLFKYPARIAINPMVSTIGWVLPEIVSGSVITALVLSLPTTGPLLYRALLFEDMFLASTLLLFLNSLTIIGTFVSDLLLMLVDPRIRFSEARR